MRYLEFRDTIQSHLANNLSGVTWMELRDTLSLPYIRPCPEWTRRLETEIGLVRQKGAGKALVWSLRR